MARNAFVSAGLIDKLVPLPVIGDAGGTMAAAIGCASKPVPGTLSNTAASVFTAVYGVGLIASGASAASTFMFARSAGANGFVAVTTRTPIVIGSVQPAAS